MPNVETKHPDPQFAKFYEYTFFVEYAHFSFNIKTKILPCKSYYTLHLTL